MLAEPARRRTIIVGTARKNLRERLKREGEAAPEDALPLGKDED